MTKTNLQIGLFLEETVTFHGLANAHVRTPFRIFKRSADAWHMRFDAIQPTQFPPSRAGSDADDVGLTASGAVGVPVVAVVTAGASGAGVGVVSLVKPCVSSSFESSQIPGLFVCNTTETTSHPSLVAALTRTCCAGRV